MFYHGTSKAPTPHEGRPASYSNVTAQLRRAPLMPRARSLCSTGCYKWGFQHRVLRGSLRWETRGAQQYHQREEKKIKIKPPQRIQEARRVLVRSPGRSGGEGQPLRVRAARLPWVLQTNQAGPRPPGPGSRRAPRQALREACPGRH